jgi:hypothetical protein
MGKQTGNLNSRGNRNPPNGGVGCPTIKNFDTQIGFIGILFGHGQLSYIYTPIAHLPTVG